MDLITKLGKQALIAKKNMCLYSSKQKNQVLINIINNLNSNITSILTANKKDLQNGEKNNLSDALLDRLMLNNDRINGMIVSLEQIIALPDPVGEITNLSYQPSGIQVGQMRVPLGVLGIIYESRPNVTIDAAALCIKSGNCVILRGGKEAIYSNIALHQCIVSALITANVAENAVQLLTDTDRKLVTELVASNWFIDAIIPRGGKGLVAAIADSAKVPVIKHLHGVCHTYIDKYAAIDKAIAVAFNGKTRRYGVCNATETLLVHKDCDIKIMPRLILKYIEKGVELRGCSETKKLSIKIKLATADDWGKEYLAPILAIKIVNNFKEAVDHIDKYSSSHTETIITESYTRAKDFLTQVDSSSVMVNVSTGFADGFEYGLGAEIGISTDKFHVRGPVGLQGLTSQKFIVLGNGHIRD